MKTTALAIVTGLALSACASVVPPSSATLAKLPVIDFGQAAPKDQDFILHYPAGTPLPVVASVTGTLLAKEGHADLAVTLKRDLWVYKSWTSLDGTTWQRSDTLVQGHFVVTVPGETDGRSPGSLAARFDWK